MNIGLRGTYAYKRKHGWSNNPENYPVRKLYLNVLGEAEENEAGLRYDFRFLTDGQLAAADPEESRYWFPVHRVFEAEQAFDLFPAIAAAGLGNTESAVSLLGQLWQSIHAVSGVHFYEETDQDVERVLDIFIRVNSAGTVLSYSDLLLSIATAQWKERDARSAIHGLVDALNSTGQGFGFTQDVVLKSGLVLAGIGDIGFKVKNFTSENMATLDRDWDSISDSLKVATGLLSDFGLSNSTLTAGSVLIPIAYYVHRRGLTQKYRESVTDAADRELMRSWTLRSLIMPGVWGSGLDSLLRDLRQAIDDHGATGFPNAEIEKRMAARGKSLAVTPEQVEDILRLPYGTARTFAVLAVLFLEIDDLQFWRNLGKDVALRDVIELGSVKFPSNLSRLVRANTDRFLVKVAWVRSEPGKITPPGAPEIEWVLEDDLLRLDGPHYSAHFARKKNRVERLAHANPRDGISPETLVERGEGFSVQEITAADGSSRVVFSADDVVRDHRTEKLAREFSLDAKIARARASLGSGTHVNIDFEKSTVIAVTSSTPPLGDFASISVQALVDLQPTDRTALGEFLALPAEIITEAPTLLDLE